MLARMDALLKDLNSEQKQAVLAIDGPVLILAGPGAGKTKTLTHRIAYLLSRGVAPENILAVTFTNKAAEEMKVRIHALLLPGSGFQVPSPLFIGTFHALCVRILRAHAGKIGYGMGFSIFDEDDSLELIKQVMKAEEVNPKQFAPGFFAHAISEQKSKGGGVEEYEEEFGSDDLVPRTVQAVWRRYQERLREANAMDFDDLLLNAVRLFEAHPEVLALYQERFRYIHVDEYQDTNHIQYALISLLARTHKNIAVVGDDAQCIFGFRGADIQNILRFEKDWPLAKVVALDQNYRSTQTILDAAREIIAQNRLQKRKNLRTDRGAGERICLAAAENEYEEARIATDCIERLLARGVMPSDIAILYRTNAQSRPFEEAFLERGIPYVLIGGVKFYQRQEIKDILAYCRFLINPKDRVSLKRIINVPARGIGEKTYRAYAARFSDPAFQPMIRNAEALGAFEALAADLGRTIAEEPPTNFLKYLLEKIRYRGHLERSFPNPEDRWQNVQDLVSMAHKYDALPSSEGMIQCLADIALMAETDRASEKKERVPLMTLHAAKGLEFSAVFLAGMEEGILPHSRALFSPPELEEERRLCYVGITRAKERLFLSYARRRTYFGSVQINAPSRFLEEIPERLLQPHESNDQSITEA